MALDEALLASASAGAPPTLRLYGWHGPWLSLGYAQPFDEAAAAACRRAGVSVVRRVTGGRAVLHGRDLTYAVAAHESALPAGLDASYRLVSDALIAALAAIGVAAERAAPAAAIAPGGAFDCFASAATDEIAVGGRKLAGSAQRR
ncbi:MAG: lipoate--protein ligase family protein, partial [Proteobacteria bacterium]